MKKQYQTSSISQPNKTLTSKRFLFFIIISFWFLISNVAYGIWGISQDVWTQGAGNVGYTGYLTLPLYLSSSARDSAVNIDADAKYKTYGGYIQYGINDNLDVGLHGNSSVNSSIGVNLKYRVVDNLTALVGFDYIMKEMMLAPFGAIIGGVNISNNFSVYGGVKTFQWSKLYLTQSLKKDMFGTVIFSGIHIYRKDGWKDRRVASFLPLGLYLELGYPVIKNESQVITMTIGLDGFLGLSFPRLQWN